MFIKSVDAVAKKYAARGSAAGADYTDGVNSTTNDWATNTGAQADTYAAGVQAAIGRGAFQKGVAAAGTDKWKRKASGVGSSRYGPGVTAAQSDYAKGVGPYLDALKNINLPKRLPKGDPGNVQRVNAVVTALHALKVSR